MADKEKLIKIKSLADKMYDAAFNLTTDASLLRKAMEEYHQFIINEYHKEELVSEELEEASFDYAEACKYDGGEKLLCVEHFKAGAKWQKAQMIKDAVEGCCFSYKNGYHHISCDIDEHITDIKMGDKVKVIVVKED